MLSSRIRVGVRSGLVAAAATGGAVLGFGLRHGDWAGPFTSLGTQVFEALGASTVPGFVAPLIGIAAHAAWMTLWGVVFATLVHRRSFAIAGLVAALVGVAAALAARSVVPSALGAVRFAPLPGAQVVLCLVLMTGGLVMGRALATSARVD